MPIPSETHAEQCLGPDQDCRLNPLDYSSLSKQCEGASSDAELRTVAKTLDEAVFWANDPRYAKLVLRDFINPGILRRNDRPVLMFHLYGWLYGGAERALTSVLNHLSSKFNVILVVFEPIENKGFRLERDITFLPIMGDNRRVERLLTLVRLIRPDVFVGNNNSIPEFMDVYPCLHETGIRSIAYNHEYYYFPHNHAELFKFAVKRNRCLSKATVACFLTKFSASAYSLVNDNAALMPNPNTFAVGSPPRFDPNRKIVLAVGRFSDPIKRLDRLIRAFKLVVSRHPEARLVVVGPFNLEARIPRDSEKTISEIMRELELTEAQVTFAGERVNTAEFYENADVFALTSQNEGFAMVLTEAATFGLPAVIFDIPGLDEIVINDTNGFIVQQDDIAGMAGRIAMLLDDVALRKKMSIEALKLSERFTIDRIGDRWEKLMRVVLDHDSQDEINEALSRDFMIGSTVSETTVKRVVNEYENLARKVESLSTSRVDGLFFVPQSIENAIRQVRSSVASHGYRVTWAKIRGRIRREVAFRVRLRRHGRYPRR